MTKTLIWMTLLCGMSGPEGAQDLIRESGLRGGLVVHVGCGDPALLAALRINDSFLVHGLDRDPGRVEKARKHLQSLPGGLYGKVSVMHWTGSSLPYADNMVNLIVVSDPAMPVSKDELLRALAPGGMAFLKEKGWTKIVKPRPKEMGEWTHALHGPDGNAVGADLIVSPPRHLQWMATPAWARLHDAPSTTSAIVSSGGRVFYIGDEGPTGTYQGLEDKWSLVARDAFNGVLLWKRPMPEWGWKQWTANWHARNNQPFQLAKRLVAIGETVYVTLGFNAPLVALDAATGKTLKTYEGTERTDEILVLDGLLILSLNKTAHKPAPGNLEPLKKSIAVVRADTGEILWKKGDFIGVHAKTASIRPVGRLELAVADGRIFLVDNDAIVALDLKTGEDLWRAKRPEAKTYSANFNTLMNELSVLVAAEGVVLFAQPEGGKSFHSVPGTLYAFDAKDGRPLWKQRYGGWVHNTPPNVFVIGGMVWIHEHLDVPLAGKSPKNQADLTYAVLGLDPRTGKEKKRFSTRDILNVGHHHRCYRNKATERFLLMSRRGVEFIDLETGENDLNHWTRGDCQTGLMPCNGLLYMTPHPCSCYIDTKLNGYFALAGLRGKASKEEAPEALEKGPASPPQPGPAATSWSAFRASASRSGSITTRVPPSLERLWASPPGTQIGPLSVAQGKVFVPIVDEHRVVALDADTGKSVWSFTAGGRIDTPPTIFQGMALFGSADGRVYAVRSDTGDLIWKRRIAPKDSLVGCKSQLESAWPVHGSVLVHEGKLYAAAGRSTYLDGGIHFYALRPGTGEVLEHHVAYSPDPKTGKMPKGSDKEVPGMLSDVLVGVGTSVWMRRNRVFGDEEKSAAHVYATGGFRDDSWFNRTTWQVGNAKHAQFLVFDERFAYGIAAYAGTNRAKAFEPGAKGYRLFAIALKAPRAKDTDRTKKKRKGAPAISVWSIHVPIRGTAMALAGDVLFVAGAPDVVDPSDRLGAFEGRKGMVLCAFSTADGKKLTELKLESLPVWDGLAASDGRLYLATQAGRVICLEGKER